jgi:hypothetical protein
MKLAGNKLYNLSIKLFFVSALFLINQNIFGQLSAISDNDTVCFGVTGSGELIVNAAGGTGDYTYELYLFSPFTFLNSVGPTSSTTATFSGLNPAEYMIRITNTDGNPPIAIFPSVIEDPELNAGTITVTQDLSCFNSSDLILRANPSGGKPPYTYTWRNGNAEGQTTQEATGLDASQSVYSVEVNDAHSCGPNSSDAIRGLTFPVPPAINISTVTTTLTCEGTQNGTITINAAGGTAPLSYSVVRQTPSDSITQASNVFNNLGSGTYTPWVIDANSCTLSDSDVLVDSVPQPVAPGITKDPADATVCAGQTLTVSTTPGTGGSGTVEDQYRYSTDNGASWSAWSTSVPSFAAVTGINLIESRRTSTGAGCSTSPSNQVSWIVVDLPVAPGITKNPADAIVCAGQTLTVATIPGTGGTGVIADEYRYSTDNGASWSAWDIAVPSFAAVAGTNLIESRRTATGTGCTTSPSNQVSWIVEAQPVAPGLTKNPNVADVCEGTTLTVTITPGSGGAGTVTDEYRFSTDNGVSWSAWDVAVPSFASVIGTNLIESRRTATGSNCSTSPSNQVSWIVVAQPTAPIITKAPNVAEVCEGTGLTVNIVGGAGGAGITADEYRYSTDNGASWSAWDAAVPAFAAVVGTNLIESRRTASGTGCVTSPSNQVSWIVVDQPIAPGITRNPDVNDVCVGTTLSVTITPGSGGSGTIADEYRFSTDNGTSWSAWDVAVPSFAAVVGANLIESRRTATGSGCTVSPSNQVSWTVTALPVAPGITKDPVDATVCATQTLTVTTTPGSGGAGSTADEYRYSTDNGATWTAWGTSVPSFAAVTGTNLIESRRTATGTGCATSASNQVSWAVVDQPVAPGITRNPNTASVCEGQTLTVAISAGTGGTGTIADEYRFSTDNGASWSAWDLAVPSFAAVVGTNLIESRRTADGTGCSTSPSNQVSWTVDPQPVAPGITRNPDANDVCEGLTLSVTTTPGSGGSGTVADEYRYSTDNGLSWSAWDIAVPSFAAVIGTNLVESRRTSSGSGCSTSASNQVSWNVVAQPVAPVITKAPDVAEVCSGTGLTVLSGGGSGGAGTTADEYRYSTDNGASWSAWSTSIPAFAAVTGTNLIESRRTASGPGCTTSASNQVSWTVVDQPVAPGLTRNPDENDVCVGQILTVVTTAGSGGSGAITDEYRYSTDNGTSWTAWSTTVPSFAAVLGTNLVESRRTATGSGCTTSPSNQVTWNVVAQPVAPGITKVPVDATVCSGQTLTVTTTPGSGGAGTTADEYRFSTDNGTSWSAWSTTVPSFAAVTGTNLIESRRTSSSTGCSTSPSNQVSWAVVDQPVAPGITRNPDVDDVCEGQILTVATTPGTGGTGTIADEYRFSTDNGASWSAWDVAVPNFAAVIGTNLIESRRTADGAGCSTSPANQVSWNVAAPPVAPGITRNPDVNDVCEGTTLSVTTTPGSGGSGTITDEYRYSTDNGATWSAWNTTVPSFAAVIGTNLVESRRTATGTGCATSASNQVSWNVVAQPVAPTISKNPADASVCEGVALTIIVTAPGSGGTGSTADEFRFSTDNGATWSGWSTIIPNFAAVTGTNLIESRRTATGTGCTTSPSNQVSWIVEAQPEAPGITRDPDVDDVCEGTVLTVATTPGIGGAGATADEYRFSTDNGVSWSAWDVVVPSFNAVTGTNLIESRRTASGTGCATSPSNQVSWNVNQFPTADAGFDGDACGLDHSLFAFPSIGTGTWNQISGPGSVVSWTPDQNTANAVVTVDAYGTYEFTWTEDNNGCSDEDTVSVTFHRAPESIAGTDAAICNDSVYTILDADTNYTNTIVWVTSGTGTFNPADNVIDPTYVPSQADRDSGSVWLYLEAYGHPSCLGVPAIDSLELSLAPRLTASIGAPIPFPIGPNTQIEVHVKTSGHAPNQDLSYHLVAPDGKNRVVLKESPNKYLPLGATDCNYGFDVDLYFTTEKPADDTLVICTGTNPSALIEDTVNATGAWDSIYGLNPAQGGWTIELYDYILLGPAFEGVVEDYYISFTDTNTATGLLETVLFEVQGGSVQINDGPGWPAYGLTSLQAPRELTTSCNSSCDAQAIVTVTGGVPPYASYDWTPLPAGGNGADSVLLCAGKYEVLVTDAIGCTAIDSVTVVEPPAIVFDTLYYTDTLFCNGDTTASITIKASRDGVSTGLTYILLPTNDTLVAADSGYFNNLSAGAYTVEVWDGFGCFIDTTLTIAENTQAVFDTAYLSQALTCSGDTTGEITAVGMAGTPPYTFILHPDMDTLISNDTVRFANLSEGDYFVRMFDFYNCKADTSDTIAVSMPSPLVIDTAYFGPDIICLGDTTVVTVVSSGGTAPYNVTLQGPAISTQSDITDTTYFDVVEGGRYYIILEDAAGCIEMDSIDIPAPVAPLIFDSINVTDVTGCYDEKTGSIAVFASGGWGMNYTYEYNGFAFPIADTNVLLNIGVGDYTIRVTDSLGCFIDSTVTINGPDTLRLNVTLTQANADQDGSIHLAASGGTIPYGYWFDTIYYDTSRVYAIATDTLYTDLEEGWYYFAVRDAQGCIINDSAEIIRQSLDVDVEVVNPICYSDYLGRSLVRLTFYDGISPYSITNRATGVGIDTVYGTPIFTDSIYLFDGSYDIRIQDSSGLFFDTTIVAIVPDPFTITEVTETPKSCSALGLDGNPTNDGAAEIISSGGVGNIEFLLESYFGGDIDTYISNDPGTGGTRTDSAEFTGLGAQNLHRITVTDANGCWDSTVFEIKPYYVHFSGLGPDTAACNFNQLELFAGIITRNSANANINSSQKYKVEPTWSPEEIFIDYYIEGGIDSGRHYALAQIRDDVEIILEVRQMEPLDSEYELCMFRDTLRVELLDTIGMEFYLEESTRYTFNEETSTLYINEGEMFTVELPSGYRHTMFTLDTIGWKWGDRVDPTIWPPNDPIKEMIAFTFCRYSCRIWCNS